MSAEGSTKLFLLQQSPRRYNAGDSFQLADAGVGL
jgi:hypothetical protein